MKGKERDIYRERREREEKYGKKEGGREGRRKREKGMIREERKRAWVIR